MEASVILMKCRNSGLLNGVRIQKMEDGDWCRTWAFAIGEKRAGNEGYDTNVIQGSLYYLEGFCGCSYCGRKGFVQCGVCQKLTCFAGETDFTCKWCGNYSNSITEGRSFDVSGGEM